ncbi:hybrid sensor histidine kinase/response regulator transcription factor [Sinomicrobium soli]|uniref:hybrid sensor histidine kinase/response regulator transcription factor n=1 Tax=Sinomicrobium sp. N-1-3-6 TaxID=2219864 RepID=UPI000DCF00B7|nr:hybrid sensor histidine kinase/response regulator transcription factor [Sinomicrobium sp. N-1-3-6]RAV27743.1 hybrid sensor histidine kinase/response regulator [Sinomicrobium sp. N-1-3-6]
MNSICTTRNGLLFFTVFLLIAWKIPGANGLLINGVEADTTIWHKDSPDIHYRVMAMDNSMGLSNSSVNCIFRDSDGLLWLGTWDGLNIFNGRELRIFVPSLQNRDAISNQVILKIGEDEKGNLWILTMYGINHYIKKEDRFQHFFFQQEDTLPHSRPEYNFAINSEKQIVCAAKGWGLGYFSGTRFVRIRDERGSFQHELLQHYSVKKMEFVQEGMLALLLDNGSLYLLSVHKNASGEMEISQSLSVGEHIKEFERSGNDMLLLEEDGMVRHFRISGRKPEKVLNGISGFKGRISEGVVMQGDEGYLLFTDDRRMVIPAWLKLLDKYNVNTIYRDKDNILWIGTDGDGVLKVREEYEVFHKVDTQGISQLKRSIVRAFERDMQNNLCIGTKGEGLIVVPESDFRKLPGGSYRTFNNKNSGANNFIYALKAIDEGLILIGSDGEGIQVYDIRRGKVIPWKEISGDRQGYYFGSVYAIYQDDEGYIWLGTNGYGLVKLSLSRQGNGVVADVLRVFNTQNNSRLKSNIIYALTERNEDQLWVGTRLGGLHLFDKNRETFKVYTHDPGNDNTISSNDILYLYNDRRGKLWIGTSLGLNGLGFQEGAPVFEKYTIRDGLANNTVHGIVPDTDDNLWITTNFGLSHFIKEEEKFVNYYQGDGLQNNEFADGAVFYDRYSGQIFAGGIRGFNYFDPSEILPLSATIPDLYIEKIAGPNTSIPYYRSLLVKPGTQNVADLDLKYNQNFLNIYLSALSYIRNDKIQYAYRLNEFDMDWNHIENTGKISFTNIPAGTYGLWLKWTNEDGIWSEPVEAIRLKIHPPLWKTDVAYVFYVLLISAFLWFLYSYNQKKQRLKQNILFQKREEEIHQNRLTFFTNIAHELQTPLTLMMGPAHKLTGIIKGAKAHSYLDMIRNNASRMLFLIQQLLEFRKAEYGHLEVMVRRFDTAGLLSQLVGLFDEWAKQKDIRYQVNILEPLKGWYDKDKMEKIIFNLLSNAFKYTPEGGDVQFAVRMIDEGEKRIRIKVSNSGKGIPGDKLDSLFDRFASTDIVKKQDIYPGAENEIVRTGIGLAYIKKLTDALKGTIRVKSVRDKKTTFTIELPCAGSSFTPLQRQVSSEAVYISSHLKNLFDTNIDFPDATRPVTLKPGEENRKTVMLVEDQYNVHHFIRSLLREKYDVISAYSGEDALLKLKEASHPDLIVSDISMAEMSGITLCRMVKSEVETCQIPFVLLTARDSYATMAEGLESGADAYIPKPFHPDYLMEQIEKLLSRNKLIRDHFLNNPSVITSIKVPDDETEKSRAERIVELIRENMAREDLAEILEQELGMSSSTYYRTVRELFDQTPGTLIRTVRLKYAATLLRESSLNISEICYRTGFNNRSYFFREFKKMYNTSPKNYKIRNK